MNDRLRSTSCAICRTFDNSTLLYPANFSPDALTPELFSSRRLPDGIHFAIVKCNSCGLVRSDPAGETELIHDLYRQSRFDGMGETACLQETYGKYLDLLRAYREERDSLLEVGCGNGYFLEEALARGYRRVTGVEPSRQAVLGANETVKGNIICDVMRPGLLPPSEFDVTCAFQVLDHVQDPAAILNECYRILKPGGLLLCLNHNIDAISARVLREASPIIDIEHTYLYGPTSLALLFRSCNFQVRQAGSAYNKFSLRYLTRLAPLPRRIKRLLLRILENCFVGKLRLNLPLGNFYMIGQRA